MTTINLTSLEVLVEHLKTTQAALNPNVSPVIMEMRDETKEIAERLKEANKELSMQHLGIWEDNFTILTDLPDKTTRKSSQEEDVNKMKVDKSKTEKSVNAAINWLIETSTTVVKVLDHHSVTLGALLKHHEEDVKKINIEIEKVEQKAVDIEKKAADFEKKAAESEMKSVEMEKECDEVIQRQLDANGTRGKESNLKMILRVVKEKTGVNFTESEVQAFHPLDRRQGAGEGAVEGAEGGRGRSDQEKQPNSYILRIWNRRPGSNWEILKEGLRSGMKADGQTSFDKDFNVSINYMLTRSRGLLAKAARETRNSLKKDGKLVQNNIVFKYFHDENGLLKVKHLYGQRGKWTAIRSLQELEQYTLTNFSTTYPTHTRQS